MTLVTTYVKTHTPAISIAVRATSSKLLMAAADCRAALRRAPPPSPVISGTRKVFTGRVVLTMTLLSGQSSSYDSVFTGGHSRATSDLGKSQCGIDEQCLSIRRLQRCRKPCSQGEYAEYAKNLPGCSALGATSGGTEGHLVMI